MNVFNRDITFNLLDSSITFSTCPYPLFCFITVIKRTNMTLKQTLMT